MASLIYNSFFDDLFRGKLNLAEDEFAVMLVTKDYRPDKGSHVSRGDVTDEIKAEGYVRGGRSAGRRVW